VPKDHLALRGDELSVALETNIAWTFAVHKIFSTEFAPAILFSDLKIFQPDMIIIGL
jgi:hypothetical protein